LEADLKEVIIEALNDARDAFVKLDSNKLKSISDYTIHYAGIFQDSYSINLAIVIYSLAKVVEARKLRETEKWPQFKEFVMRDLNEALVALIKNDEKDFVFNLKDLLKDISDIDRNLSEYVRDVIETAKIKKGSAIYRHGLSVGMAAKLMGISPWELMEYIGHTRLADELPSTEKTPKERLYEARRIFNLTK